MRAKPFFSRALLRDDLEEDQYPRTVPAFEQIASIRFHPGATILTGENGCGKSTILEALAIAAGLPSGGGTRNFRFVTDAGEADLDSTVTLERNAIRERHGFFLRAETAFQMFTHAEAEGYGGVWRGLHSRSHGEAFMDVFATGFRTASSTLFFLDEIESALSPAKQIEMLGRIHQLVEADCQIVLSTHSPILMSYPNARLYWLDENGIEERSWQETEHSRLYEAFFKYPAEMQARLGIAPIPPTSLLADDEI